MPMAEQLYAALASLDWYASRHISRSTGPAERRGMMHVRAPYLSP